MPYTSNTLVPHHVKHLLTFLRTKGAFEVALHSMDWYPKFWGLPVTHLLLDTYHYGQDIRSTYYFMREGGISYGGDSVRAKRGNGWYPELPASTPQALIENVRGGWNWPAITNFKTLQSMTIPTSEVEHRAPILGFLRQSLASTPQPQSTPEGINPKPLPEIEPPGPNPDTAKLQHAIDSLNTLSVKQSAQLELIRIAIQNSCRFANEQVVEAVPQ